MTGEDPGAAHSQALRRIANILAAAGIFALAMLPSRATEANSPQLIIIPPAKLPAAGGPPPASPTIPVAPRQLLPMGIEVLRDDDGTGLVMYGALNGKAASAVGVVLAIFAYSEAFDTKPSPLLVLADQDDRHAQVLFTATVQGAPAVGLAVAALDDWGGDATVFYDSSDDFADSFPRLRQALAERGLTEIGRTDNSVCECQAPDVPAAGWESLIAAAKAGENPAEPSLSQPLAALLPSGSGGPWRLVAPAEWK